MNERCENCRFWALTMRRSKDDGQCRFRAPAKYFQTQIMEPLPRDRSQQEVFALRMVETGFPPMYAGEWCGEWQAIPLDSPAQEVR